MKIDAHVHNTFPDLNILTTSIEDVTVTPKSSSLEEFKKEFISKIKSSYTLETLKDVPELRLYRDFFWKIGIDPTKVRPASEALIRRVVQGKPLPTINTLVDSYNLASMESRIPLAAFDSDKISPNLLLRFAVKNEQFTGIGMKSPVLLEGNELVIQSGDDIIALYPHRDADRSKVTLSTRTVLVVVCGVPGIPGESLRNARTVAEEYIMRFCSEK
jgi:DNA/RNA-binding domain of Phe-tRNA-synthetase-like protein